MARLQERLREHFHKDPERFRAGSERVRTYHEPRNLVTDHKSGKTFAYKDILNDIAPAVEARRAAFSN